MRTWTLVALAGMATMAQAGDGKMTQVRQQVQVASTQGKVVVTLSVENGGAKPVYVPKALFAASQLFGRAFDITDAASGAEIGYIGPMVKRGPYTKADYLAIKPGGKHSHSIDITPSYAFKAGKHSYTLAYQGSYLGDIAKLDAPTALASAPVSFSYTGK
jgi:hypothetical protein